ncbi:E3 ubiquitin-protein ligase MUL1 [Apostasia shenzhenica]|uniref:E3 ubiquitin-protein ligase MUL1 n=1 Tax=Apostasia shenzhenica TaxID=1088818 RepID=A0A2I0AUL9_9ASPA|nr:E3 ubiquitin-protein ligase MUL1 [Apostasia shenzhenica]
MDRFLGGDSPMLLEDFGQRVDLTRRIREVLVDYPEGTTVLKELIQNADDAGATKVCLCLDRRSHGVDSLLSSKLAQWQGPALLAYNDAVFTEDDFVNISRIGDSKKQGQAWKTGRFGVGFNSVYHLTDLPSFVSNKYVVLFDPHGSYLPNVSAANPGKRLDYVSSKAICLYEDQFVPYCAFGCDMRKPFQGTLFRFPLRNADQAAISKLSKHAYTENDISFMLSKLYEESVLCLLFLKSVILIEMYIWDAGMDIPQRLYSCTVRSSNEDIAWHRQTLMRLSSSSEAFGWNFDSFSMDFQGEAIVGENTEKRLDSFFIVQAMAPASSKTGTFAAVAAKEYDLHLLPWASLAICLSDALPKDHVLKQGRAFCFLPLPVRTGLSVHVNGYFEVSSNRRNIWFGADMDKGGKMRSDWNRLLLEDIVAPAFGQLLISLTNLLGPSEHFYSLWPIGSFEEPWSILVEKIYEVLYSAQVLYSDYRGGEWISPADAFFHDVKFSKSELLAEVLSFLGMPIVYPSNNIVEMMLKYCSNLGIKLVNPVTIRSFLKLSGIPDNLNRTSKFVLLEYCLSDLSNDGVGEHANGLSLIPLANGDFGVLFEAKRGPDFYICNTLEYKLLSVIPDRIVDKTIPPGLFGRLSEIARCSTANLAFFDEKSFLQFLTRFFPTEWRFKNRVPWCPGTDTGHPSAGWFSLFWEYVHEQSYDISIFDEWPILPSTSGHLYRASKISKLLNTENLSNTMRELLGKIGCKILDTGYQIKHHDLYLYVSDSNFGSILSSIFDVISFNGNELEQLFQNLSVHEKIELRKFLLDPKWYHGSVVVSDFQIKIAKKLPIYSVYGQEFSNNICLHTLESPKRYLTPMDVPECLLDGNFVFCSSVSEAEILLRFYCIERMQKSAFYKKFVLSQLGELQSEVRDTVMLSILKELPQLSLEDPSVKGALQKLKFVPVMNGTLECPETLYDPRVDELYALLEESDCFPHGLFQEPSVLDMLLCLGLRTSVSLDTIIRSARHVESLVLVDQLKACLHGRLLLSYLEVHAVKWFCNNENQKGVKLFSRMSATAKCPDMPSQTSLDNFWNDLRMICWCPVLVSAPHNALPWPPVSSMVAPPKLVRLKGDMWLVSASSRILNGECSSSALSSCLGWSYPPSGNVLAAQLLELGKNNEIVEDQTLRRELALAMPKIYSLLTNLIGREEMDVVKAILEGCRWIWVGDGFATANEVVLTGQFHLSPFIRIIPVDLAVFRDLFLELGIQEYLKPADYANILSRMASKKGCIPLAQQELQAAVWMAQHLAGIQFQNLQVEIYLPDLSSRLTPATDLIYNDAPWLLDVGDKLFGDGGTISLKPENNLHKFIHGNISNEIAEKLGVRSFRHLVLAASSNSMNLGLSGVAEVFGQHEALTTRLKHIVEMYADGPGVLFELMQNAEDAQASEVVFLLDETQYGILSILSPQMAEWQGPALYCFNDSVFSSQDLYAISRIGQDSKLEKPFAIGRFGLGFNCVYHFTDIPSFVSGENIVIFDPHASHLPGISPTHPGLRIKFVGRKILEQFPDQFTPFLQFGCDLQQPFPGTLFRFPLRNEAAAGRSQIKKEKYSPEDVKLLFYSFTEVVSEALLFLRHVKRVTIFIKDGSSHDMHLIHRVSRHSSTGFVKELQPNHTMLNFVHGNCLKGMDRVQFIDKLGKTADNDLPWNCQKIVVLEQSQSDLHLHVWIVSECIGGGHAKSRALAAGNQSFKFIPWASVAAYLHTVNLRDLKDAVVQDIEVESYLDLVTQGQLSADQDRKVFLGRAFCFLPLPISTSLPAHINAYFELSSNRRDIWFGEDMTGGGKVRSEWNLCLLEDVVTPAYGHLLHFIAQELGPCDLFFSFWPTAVDHEPWASLVRKFYLILSDLGLPILYTKARAGQWIAARQAIFPDFKFSKVHELSEILSEAGLPVVCVSNEIVDRFMDSCPSLHFLSPQLLRNVLIRRKRGFKKKDAIITALEYCLSDSEVFSFHDSFCSSLYGLPLVPLANGLFTTFNKRGEGDKVFVMSHGEYDLMKSVPHLLLDCSVPDNILMKLLDIANSSQTNLHRLTCHSLLELFPRIFPLEWQHAKQVQWMPRHEGQPSVEWMVLLWSYLKASCNDLSIFSSWPILPVKNDFLLQLTENSTIIKDNDWSENLYSLLQKLGCHILMFELPIDHPQLTNFVHDATAFGILNAIQGASCQLQGINDLFLNASRAERRELRSFILQSKWFSRDQIGLKQIEIIKSLPVFESYSNEHPVSLTNPVKWLKPSCVHEDLLDENFIKTDSDTEKRILQSHLGIREATKVEFYKKFVLHRIQNFMKEPSILFAILLDVQQLVEEDDSIRYALSDIPFVLAADGSWKHPSRCSSIAEVSIVTFSVLSRLYDPRVPGLQNLLNKEVFFPCDKFSNSEILDILVSFGLRKNLNFSGLIDAARSVWLLHESGNKDAPIFGRTLLSYMNALGIMLSNSTGDKNNFVVGNLVLNEDGINPKVETDEEKNTQFDEDTLSFLSTFIPDKPEDEFWSELKTIPWCPVYINPLLPGLPWFISDHQVAPPNITRPKSQLWMVSSKMRILDGDYGSTYVAHKLGWINPPDLSTLSAQLVALSKSYNQLKLLSEHKFSVNAILQREIPQLISLLQGYVDTEDFKVLREALEGVDWVWVGDAFVSPKSVAFASPVKYYPYLYAVPSELSEYRSLLTQLGVRLTFDAMDYLHVLQCLHQDANGEPLSVEHLGFVQCVLEAFVDSLADKQPTDALLNLLLIPNSSGFLMHPQNLVYNDAPWMDNYNPSPKQFLHPDISNDLAKRLGIQSVRSLSLIDEKMTRNLPCMDYARISEILSLYGETDFLLFDLLALADYLKAKKLHLIYDKRQHPKQSLLQHNLGDFQGSALTFVLDGAILSIEEVCSLQLPPPWKIRGYPLNYGLGLVGSYVICDILTILSNGYFYMFDPLGLALAASLDNGPSAKIMSSFVFLEVKQQLHLYQNFLPTLSSKAIISSKESPRIATKGQHTDCHPFPCSSISWLGSYRWSSSMATNPSMAWLVSLFTWEDGNLNPSLDYSVSIDPSASIMRNPFTEKKWRKFQLSRLFSSSHAAIKGVAAAHLQVCSVQSIKSVIRDALHHKGTLVLKWPSFSHDEVMDFLKYLSYNLTPVAGVAAHISQDGQAVNPPRSSNILSPLPLSGEISMPVTVLGSFLIFHNGGRCLFRHSDRIDLPESANLKSHLIDAWNKELMLCARDSYIELILEFQKIKKDYLSSAVESNTAHGLSYILQAYGDRIYSFWPRSKKSLRVSDGVVTVAHERVAAKAIEADWASLVEQVIRPFYVRLVDLPVWQLYCGNMVKANEGMFLSQSDGENDDNLPPARVCSFIKEHYPVFSVPCELVKEIQEVGLVVREITPRMIRNLLKNSATVFPQSIETYIDVLDYCLSDVQPENPPASELSGFNNRSNSTGGLQIDNYDDSTYPFSSTIDGPRFHRPISQSSGSSGGDALEIVTYLSKALYDFGRGVVEDMGRAASPSPYVGTTSEIEETVQSLPLELKGLPFPTSNKCLMRLGSVELWIGSKDQQLIMHTLADKFIHVLCLEKSNLVKILTAQAMHSVLKLKSFTPQLVSDHLKLLFAKSWVGHVMIINQAPWVSWDKTAPSGAYGPHPDWIRLFWKVYWNIRGDLSLVSDWPLIPAFLHKPILCRVKERELVFIPPISDDSSNTGITDGDGAGRDDSPGSAAKEIIRLYHAAFASITSRCPWLLFVLGQLNIPIYDVSFLDIAISFDLLPTPDKSLGQVIVSKLLAAKCSGCFSVPINLSVEDRDRLFTLFAMDSKSPRGCVYKREELDLLKELPIYKTVTGSYTMLVGSDHFLISPTAFFHPKDDGCLSHSADVNLFLHALGVFELTDQEVFVRFALPGFEGKTSEEQEDILLYLYMNWKDLQLDAAVVNLLKETNFVRNANEVCADLFKPRDLMDLHDSLLSSVFCGERNKFPGERFITEGWLRILRKAGLRTSLQADMIIECAKKVELLGCESIVHIDDLGNLEASHNEVSLETWSLGESVVEAMFANFPSLFNNDFCEKIAKISFVPAEKGFPNIGGKKGGKRILSSYSEAILLKDWPLAWSTAPILTKQNVIPPEYSWGAFHLRSPPPFTIVLKHLQVIGRNNGEDTLAHWPASLGMITVEDASFEILKYLDKVWGTISSSDMRELQKIAFIPVANGTRFVMATSLFVRLAINLSPFAFELPSVYLPYVSILKEIGVQEVLTTDYARDVVVNIQKTCGYQRLNPNELRAVMEILNFICNRSIEANQYRSDGTFDAIVPDDSCRLVSASSCVFVDKYGSQFLSKIDKSRLRFSHPDLSEHICLALGIKKISDIVIEELDESNLHVVHQIGSVQLNKIKDKLLSKTFQDAVWNLIDGMEVHSPLFQGMNSEQLEMSLRRAASKLQFVTTLNTRFFLLPNNVDITQIPPDFVIPEWEWSPRNRTVHFVDRLRNLALVAVPPSYTSLYDVIAAVVSQMLEAPSVLPIGPLLACPDGSEKAILNVVNLGAESGLIRDCKNIILAGRELQPQDALQVQFLPMRPFYRGEIVAWKSGKEGDKLRYGIVLQDARPSSSQTIYKFPVEIAPGEQQPLLSTQVFSFRSVSLGNSFSLSSVPVNIKGPTGNGLLHVQGTSNTANCKIANELQYGRVSSEETVRAISDMLSAAGINMDADRQALLQSTLTLQEQVKEFQVALLVEQEKAEIATKEADAAKAAWTCRVCLGSEVDTTIVPCGHVLCDGCCSVITRCPFCRHQVSRKMKIFRP